MDTFLSNELALQLAEILADHPDLHALMGHLLDLTAETSGDVEVSILLAEIQPLITAVTDIHDFIPLRKELEYALSEQD